MASNFPYTVCITPLVRYRAAPVYTLVVARDMIKDGALNKIDRTPLKKVQNMAVAMPAAAAAGIGMPEFIIMAIRQELKPMTAPTDMSKFPDMISMVAPAATRPSTAICSNMFITLFSMRNLGFFSAVSTDISKIINRSMKIVSNFA